MSRQSETLTPEEAAKYLRVSPATVYRHLRSGRLPGAKVGQQWRIRKVDLDRYLSGDFDDVDHDEDDELTPEELADAEAGWREYLEGKARPWDEIRKELTHDA